MDNQKNNKGLIALVIVLFLTVLVMGGYILNDKVLIDKKNPNNEITDNSGKENTSNKNNEINNNCIDSNEIDLSKLKEFKNTDGSLGQYDTLNFENWDREFSYTIGISLDGYAIINNNKSGWNWQKLNISDVDSIVSFSEDPSALGYCYILTKNNEVYYYDLTKAASKNYDVVKVDNATDIVKLIKISYCPMENAGCAYTLVAIKKDGSYIEIASFSI